MEIALELIGNPVPSDANTQFMKIPKQKLTETCHTPRYWKYSWCGKRQFNFLKYYDTHFEIEQVIFHATSRMQPFESV